MKYPVIITALIFLFSINTSAQLLTMEDLDEMDGEKSFTEAIISPKSVIKLVVKGDEIEELDFQIRKMTNLQYLVLNKCEIREFPEGITTLSNLQYLDLSKNDISKIPDEIANLKHLKYMGLSKNNVYVISPKIGELKEIEELDLWDNPIKEFPMEMRGMSSLKKLDIRVVQINEEEKKKLQKLLPYTKIKFSKTCDCN